jgi:predicted PurR-regulated permease PerM
MDILRNLFGSVTSGIIRLLVTVGILAAAYIFIVKPVLDTTDHAFDTVHEAMQESGINDIGKSIEDANRRVQRQIQRQVRHSFQVSQQTGTTQQLVKCIQRSHRDVHRIHRCTIKY